MPLHLSWTELSRNIYPPVHGATVISSNNLTFDYVNTDPKKAWSYEITFRSSSFLPDGPILHLAIAGSCRAAHATILIWDLTLGKPLYRPLDMCGRLTQNGVFIDGWKVFNVSHPLIIDIRVYNGVMYPGVQSQVVIGGFDIGTVPGPLGDVPVFVPPEPTPAPPPTTGNDIINLLIAYLNNILIINQSIVNLIAQIPVIGPALANIFQSIVNQLSLIVSVLVQFSAWMTRIETQIANIFEDIRDRLVDAFPILSMSPDALVAWLFGALVRAFPILAEGVSNTYQTFVDQLLASFSILNETRETLLSYIQNQVLSAYSILNETRETLLSYIQNQILSAYSILNETVESIWNTISTTYLNNYLAEWSTTIFNTFIEMLQSKYGELVAGLFSFLDENWDSFTNSFSWLLDRLIRLMISGAGHFAPLLFDLFEAVLRNIGGPDGGR